MIETFYISIITVLLLIIFVLIRRIRHIKKHHRKRLADLYKTLSQLTENKENTLQKIQLDKNINTVIKDAKRKLNADIFDLQIDVFRKITEN